MTTTAVRTPRAVLRRGGDVMNERFTVDSHCGASPPRAGDARRVGTMRRIAAARLSYCGLGALIDDVMLIVSELLTNALLHSDTKEISLNLAVRDGFLWVTVIDGMPGSATPKDADDDAESGRGLLLVQALVKERGGSWGTSDDGTETWCSLAVPAEEQP